MVGVVGSQQAEVLLVVFDAQEEMAVITGRTASSGPETLGDELVLLQRGGKPEVGSLVDTGLLGLPQAHLSRGRDQLLQTFLPKPGPARLALGSDQGDGLLPPALLSRLPGAGQAAGGGGGQLQGQLQAGAGQAVAVLSLHLTVSHSQEGADWSTLIG